MATIERSQATATSEATTPLMMGKEYLRCPEKLNPEEEEGFLGLAI